MLEIKEIYAQDVALKEQIEFHKQKILDYLKNEDISLDERWDNYLLLPEEFYTHNWFTGFLEYDSPDVDFFMERYEAMSGAELVSRVGTEYLSDEFDPEKVKRLKEEILQSGYTRFVFDW